MKIRSAKSSLIAFAVVATPCVAMPAFAQSANCLKPHPVSLGDTPFANLASYADQLSQSTSGFGEAYIHKAGWFAFTPDVTAQYVIGVCGASVDTKMALAAECPLGPDLAWDVLGYNDDFCAFTGGSGLWASKLFPGNPGRPLNAQLHAGTTYLIAVGGYAFGTAPASGSLHIEMVPPPVDTCAAPVVGAIGVNTLPMYATAPTLSVDCGGILYDVSKTSYLNFTAPYTGEFIAHTCAGTTDTVLAVLGSCGNGSSSLGCSDDACGSGSSVTFSALAGQTVSIGVGLYSPTAVPPATLAVTIEEAAPPVDPCASIRPLSLGTAAVALDSAMPDLTVPGTPAVMVYKVNYFTFTAPQAGVYRIDTCASAAFDSIVLRADACASGSTVTALNDDGCGISGGPSRLQFLSEAGETHVIGIGAWSAVEALPAQATVATSFVAPLQEICAPANIIEGVVGANTVPMNLAYRSLDLAGHCSLGAQAGNDRIACARIIRFTAAVTGDHIVGNCSDTDPFGTNRADARIAVLTSCGDPASAIGCDDDGCTGGVAPYTSELLFHATAGSTYYIAVGGFDETVAGPFRVLIEEPAPNRNPADINRDGVVNAADLSELLGNWWGNGAADINRDGIVDGADLSILLNSWS